MPVDHLDPDGATTDVALFRLRATVGRRGVLVANPGGPGASGIDYVSDRGRDGFPGAFDIIGFDPRGFGRSDAVRCVTPDDLSAMLDTKAVPRGQALDEALARFEAIAERCAADPLGHHMGSVDVARDVDAIRAALGDQKISYVGWSYGGLLGWTYARLFPDRVRAMVLDGPEDPRSDEADRARNETRVIQEQVDAFSRGCAVNPAWGCPADPPAAIRTILERAEVEPIATRPGTPALSGTYALNAVLSAFYEPDGWAAFGAALSAALNGDGTPLAELSYFWRQHVDGEEFSEVGAPVDLVYCADHPQRLDLSDLGRVSEEVAQITPTMAGWLPGVIPRCWGYGTLGTAAPKPPSSTEFPVLVVGATGDTATPYDGAVHLADALGDRAMLLTRVGSGHTSYGIDRCIDRFVDRFLMTAELPDRGSRCESPP